MPDTTVRQLLMLERIPRAPRRVSVRALAAHLAGRGYPIDVRTIQRDLHKLATIYPLVADDFKPTGWSWSRDAILPLGRVAR